MSAVKPLHPVHPDYVRPASERFDLPFEWDDGIFISPFVASEPAAIDTLVEVVCEMIMQEAAERTQRGAGGPGAANISYQQQQEVECTISLLDLGCGDGRVVARAAQALARRAVQAEVGSPLRAVRRISAAGVDLDEVLIGAAKRLEPAIPLEATDTSGDRHVRNQEAPALPQQCTTARQGPIISHRFEVGNMLELGVDDLYALVACPLEANDKEAEAAVPVSAGQRDMHGCHFSCVFTYLLPEGLAKAEKLLRALLPRVSCIVSNSWDIPYLESWRRPWSSSAQYRLHVYSTKHPAESARAGDMFDRENGEEK